MAFITSIIEVMTKWLYLKIVKTIHSLLFAFASTYFQKNPYPYRGLG